MEFAHGKRDGRCYSCRRMRNRLMRHHDTAMHIFGVVCPALCAVSLLDLAGWLSWTWLLFVWLGCGHFMMYVHDVYPRLKQHAFATGLFAFGVGLLWPLWLLRHVPRN
jgi:hypothetical protein